MTVEKKHEQNMIVTAYKNWIVETHPIGMFNLLEFKDFWSPFKDKKGKYVVAKRDMRRQTEDSERIEYIIAEIWLAQNINTGEIRTVKLKNEVSKYSHNDESSNIHNPKPLWDYNYTYSLIDSPEECEKCFIMRNKYPNKSLILQKQILSRRIEILKELINKETNKHIKKTMFLILRHKQSPTLNTFNTIKQIDFNTRNNIMKQVNELLDI